jgi:hypothetical protein
MTGWLTRSSIGELDKSMIQSLLDIASQVRTWH